MATRTYKVLVGIIDLDAEEPDRFAPSLKLSGNRVLYRLNCTDDGVCPVSHWQPATLRLTDSKTSHGYRTRALKFNGGRWHVDHRTLTPKLWETALLGGSAMLADLPNPVLVLLRDAAWGKFDYMQQQPGFLASINA